MEDLKLERGKSSMGTFSFLVVLFLLVKHLASLTRCRMNIRKTQTNEQTVLFSKRDIQKHYYNYKIVELGT